MLIQTKQAIQKLKAAGFDRSDFRARVEINRFTLDGKRYTEYGRVRVLMWCSAEKVLYHLDALLDSGFDVTRYITKNGESVPSVRPTDGRPGVLTVRDLRN